MEAHRGTQGLLDARATFQRLSDARILQGWIVGVEESTLIVRASDDPPLEIGEQFAVRTARLNGDVAFIAVLRDAAAVCAEEALRRADGLSGPTMLDFGDRTYAFEILGKMVPMPSTGDPRYLCEPCRVVVGMTEAELRDVSPMGMGIITLVRYYEEEQVHVLVEDESGPVEVDASVEYCRQLATIPPLYRVGLRVLSTGRIEVARWMRVVKERSRPRDRSRYIDDPAPLVEPMRLPRPEETGIAWAFRAEEPHAKPLELWKGREGILVDGVPPTENP